MELEFWGEVSAAISGAIAKTVRFFALLPTLGVPCAD